MRWTLRPNSGRLPWWVLAPGRRVPGTRARDYLDFARLTGAQRIGDILPGKGAMWDRLLAPLMISALNTPVVEGSAQLAGAIVRETLAKGGAACMPRIAEPSLAAAFVDPALAWLDLHGATLRLGCRLRGIERADGRVARLAFADGEEIVDGPVVLAVPSWVAADLLPWLTVPSVHHAIVNAHFRIAPPPRAEAIVGVIGGTAEWVFAFPDRLATTTSAADYLESEDRETLARRIWADVARVHRIEGPMPPWQIVREKRATFAATPEQDRRRPGAATPLANLWLAGDWTQTGLPATIEGAIRSGETAARLVRQRPDGHWVFELEADATIPAEYVLLRHYLGEPDDLELEGKIGRYLRRIQAPHGGWPLYHDGGFDHLGDGEGLFRAQDDRRCDRRAAYGARARRDPRAAARSTRPTSSPASSSLCSARRDRGARCRTCRRNHAAAALLPDPSVEDVLLGAHRDRAVAGARRR
jgi:squalene-associated FAD-dependent desaturase